MINFRRPILFLLQDLAGKGGYRPFMAGNLPLPARYLTISGITKDSAGTALPSCTVKLFPTDTDTERDEVVSSASGAYEFRSASPGVNHYAVAYRAGSPDVAGTTVNTLTGT